MAPVPYSWEGNSSINISCSVLLLLLRQTLFWTSVVTQNEVSTGAFWLPRKHNKWK